MLPTTVLIISIYSMSNFIETFFTNIRKMVRLLVVVIFSVSQPIRGLSFEYPRQNVSVLNHDVILILAKICFFRHQVKGFTSIRDLISLFSVRV